MQFPTNLPRLLLDLLLVPEDGLPWPAIYQFKIPSPLKYILNMEPTHTNQKKNTSSFLCAREGMSAVTLMNLNCDHQFVAIHPLILTYVDMKYQGANL